MKKRNSTVQRAARAAIETLEGRRLLSTVAMIDNGDGTSTLQITGTSGKDRVFITDDPISDIVEVFDDKDRNNIVSAGEFFIFTGENMTVLEALMKGSDDEFEIGLSSDLVTKERSYNVDLGSGNDRFKFSSSAPTAGGRAESLVVDTDGADITESSDVVFDIDGSSGNDDINLDFSVTSIICSSVIIDIDADTGNDTVGLTTPDRQFETMPSEMIAGCYDIGDSTSLPGQDGAEVFDTTPAVLQVQVDLDAGNDTMNLVNHAVLVSAVFNLNVIGSSGKDTFNDQESCRLTSPNTWTTIDVIGSGDVGSRLTVNANLGSQDDRYDGNFNFGDDFIAVKSADNLITEQTPRLYIDRTSEARFNIQGGSEKDNLRIDDADVLPSLPDQQQRQIFTSLGFINGLLEMQLYGGTGNDEAAIDLDPGAILHIGSGGVLRGIISGDSGSDKLGLDIVLTPTSHGQYDFAMLGGSGNDSLGAAFQNDNLLENTPNHYGPRGYILLDGGLGTDKWDTEGNGFFKLRSVETLLESLQDAVGA